MKRVSVFGMGYVGCVTAACLSRDGHHVIGVDVDAEKIAALAAGHTPVHEPGLDELVRQQVAVGRLEATQDVERAVRESEIALVCVGTPSRDDGSVCTRAVHRVVRAIGEEIRRHQKRMTVVVRSTLLPGILEDELAPLLEEAAGSEIGEQLGLCNNPEFLRESTAIRDYDQPPFIVVGAAESWQAQAALDLYEQVHAEHIVTDTRTAALIKYACNAFHALKIAFANEVGTLAQSLSANGHEVMRIVCRDRKLNISPAYMRPGFAFGGSCLPKDLRALNRHAEREALKAPLLGSILPSNTLHLQRAIGMVEQVGVRRVGMAGLSFKANTDDLRESPQVILAEALLGRGYDLRIYDPGISLGRLTGRNLAYVDRHLPHLAALMVDEPGQLFEHAELLVLCTDVAEALDVSGSYSGELLDLRKDMAMPQVRTAGVAT